MIGDTILSIVAIIVVLANIGASIYAVIYFYKEKEYVMSVFFIIVTIILVAVSLGALLASLGI